MATARGGVGDLQWQLAEVTRQAEALRAENAHMLDHERQRATRIATINRIVRTLAGSLSLDGLLLTAVAALAEHLHYHTIAVMLVDADDPETLVLRARGGVYVASNLGEYRQSIHEGIAGAAARERRRLLVNDVRADPRYISVPGGEALVAELALPLVVGERLLGLLNIESERPFGEADAADFEIVADALAIAIDNARLFAGTRAALTEARLLYETSQRIGAALDTDAVVQAYLQQVASGQRYMCSVVLYEFDGAGVRTSVVVRGRWTPAGGIERTDERLPHTRDEFDSLLDEGRAVTFTDVYTDPRISDEFRALLRRRGSAPTQAMIPLIAGGRRTGLVILSSPRMQEWSEADLHPYEVTAAQLAAAIDSRRQHELLAERDRQLVVLRERQRLARELHDAVTQSVFSVSLIAQSVAPAWQRDPAEGERRVERLVAQSQAALAELRAVLAELRPPEGSLPPAAPPPGSLVAALDRLAAATRDHGLEVALDTRGYTPAPVTQEQALERIAREALANVIKHAGAKRVTVHLAAEREALRLTITDDGAGFDPEAPPGGHTAGPRSGGLGLRSMRERASELGGAVHVNSRPHAGTSIEVMLPTAGKGTA